MVVDGRTANAVARARGTIAGFLTARPGLTHHMPSDAESRGGAWPSPRTWEMALRLVVFHHATGCGKDALAASVIGAVGNGAGLEFMSYLEELDLPDPERILAHPESFALPERGDRQLAFLTATVAAIQANTTAQRWAAGWTVLAKAVQAGVPDVAARAAMDLAALRDPEWPVPPDIDAFMDVLELSGRI